MEVIPRIYIRIERMEKIGVLEEDGVQFITL